MQLQNYSAINEDIFQVIATNTLHKENILNRVARDPKVRSRIL